jgi:hypothetical protein
MVSGTRGAYQWIVWESQFLSDLVAAVPQIVRGKHVAITAFDSGRFLPTSEMTGQGWSYPTINTTSGIFSGRPRGSGTLKCSSTTAASGWTARR